MQFKVVLESLVNHFGLEKHYEIEKSLSFDKGMYHKEGDAGVFKVDNKEYTIISNEREAREISKLLVLDSLKENPDIFDVELIKPFINVGNSDCRRLAEKYADSWLADLTDEQVIDSLGVSDMLDDPDVDIDEFILTAREDLWNGFYADIFKLISDSPYYFFVEYQKEYDLKQLLKQSFIHTDYSKAVDAIIDKEGWVNILTDDGLYTDIDGHIVFT